MEFGIFSWGDNVRGLWCRQGFSIKPTLALHCALVHCKQDTLADQAAGIPHHVAEGRGNENGETERRMGVLIHCLISGMSSFTIAHASFSSFGKRFTTVLRNFTTVPKFNFCKASRPER